MYPLHQRPQQGWLPPLSAGNVGLQVRQEPRKALLMVEGREKGRKPVDPPPVIQLRVSQTADPNRCVDGSPAEGGGGANTGHSHFLQSPYLFMCVGLWRADVDEAVDGKSPQQHLAGSLVSSLHRLRDLDNKDGGFFVFGDISVKKQGTFRLHFSLFELVKGPTPQDASAVPIQSMTSQPFSVLAGKEFDGLAQSTQLSRAFSDQGVRLRLRKEPRGCAGQKRSRSESQPAPPQERARAEPQAPAHWMPQDQNPYKLASPQQLPQPPQQQAYHANHTPHSQPLNEVDLEFFPWLYRDLGSG